MDKMLIAVGIVIVVCFLFALAALWPLIYFIVALIIGILEGV